MQAHEMEAVVDAQRESETRLLAMVYGLTKEQWRFREAPERWSIAENVEHLVLFERFIRDAVERALTGDAANEERRAEVRAKTPLVAELAKARDQQRFTARAVTTPTGRRTDFDAMVAEFSRERAQTISFTRQAATADLRGHFFAHTVFGDLDAYQWLMLLATHVDRHILQIKQVKADKNWPR